MRIASNDHRAIILEEPERSFRGDCSVRLEGYVVLVSCQAGYAHVAQRSRRGPASRAEDSSHRMAKGVALGLEGVCVCVCV